MSTFFYLLISLAGVFVWGWITREKPVMGIKHGGVGNKNPFNKCWQLSYIAGKDMEHIPGKCHDVHIGVRKCKVCEKWYNV